jgi:hypothetical protein
MSNSIKRPVCAFCKCHDIRMEVLAFWNDYTGRAEVSEILTKGHYCPECNGGTSIEWIDVEVPDNGSGAVSGHVCGPWISNGDKVKYLSSGRWRTIGKFSGTGFTKEADYANARLAAMSPTLLSEYRELLECIESVFEHNSLIHSKWGEGGNAKEASHAVEKTKELIKAIRARGNLPRATSTFF